MANMSYCRYSNTLSDLQDCYEAMLEELEEGSEVSMEEYNAKKRLIALCHDIANSFEED